MSAVSEFAVVGEPASQPHQASVVGEPVGEDDDHLHHPSRPHHHGRQHHRHHPHRHEQQHKGSHDDDAIGPPPALGEPVPVANGKQEDEGVLQSSPPSVAIDRPAAPAEEPAINGGEHQVSSDLDREDEGVAVSEGVPAPALVPAQDDNPFSVLSVEEPNLAHDDDAAANALDSSEESPLQAVDRGDAPPTSSQDEVAVPEVAPVREAEEPGVYQEQPSDEVLQVRETVQGETDEPCEDAVSASEVVLPAKEDTDDTTPATSEIIQNENKASVSEGAANLEVSPPKDNAHADQSVGNEPRVSESCDKDDNAAKEEAYVAPHAYPSSETEQVTGEENADDYLPVKHLHTEDSPTGKATLSQASGEEPIISACVPDVVPRDAPIAKETIETPSLQDVSNFSTDDHHKESCLANEPAEVNGGQQETKQREGLSKGTTVEVEYTPPKDINGPKTQPQESGMGEPTDEKKKKLASGSKMPLMFITGIAIAVAGGLLVSLSRSH